MPDYINFIRGEGVYGLFNDPRISPFQSCKIGVYTDKLGVFQTEALFPGATYQLTVHFDGVEHVRQITLSEEAEQHITISFE